MSASTLYVRTAAEFPADQPLILAPSPIEKQNWRLRRVFLAEQRASPGLHSVVYRHQIGVDWRVLLNDAVCRVFHEIDLIGAHGLGIGEIETQPIGGDERPFLRHVITEV